MSKLMEGVGSMSTVLRIGLCCSTVPPNSGTSNLGMYAGGPEVLLRWMETQLGLLTEPLTQLQRVQDYAFTLDRAPTARFAASLRTDRWATAVELLERRSELRIAGWDGVDTAGLPDVVRDMGRAELLRKPEWPDQSDRLMRVLEALKNAQV